MSLCERTSRQDVAVSFELHLPDLGQKFLAEVAGVLAAVLGVRVEVHPDKVGPRPTEFLPQVIDQLVLEEPFSFSLCRSPKNFEKFVFEFLSAVALSQLLT